MYTAYVLTQSARDEILKRFPPKFDDVIAHHITYKFKTDKNVPHTIPDQAVIKVVAYACDKSLETLVVSVDGEIQRPDGKFFHITLSLDRSKGRKPVDSNDVIENKIIYDELFEVETFEIETIPKIIELNNN